MIGRKLIKTTGIVDRCQNPACDDNDNFTINKDGDKVCGTCLHRQDHSIPMSTVEEPCFVIEGHRRTIITWIDQKWTRVHMNAGRSGE